MAQFFAANLVFVYLVYGFAFLALGLVLGLQARTPIRMPGIGLLAGFGLLHGLAEWSALGVVVRSQPGQEATSSAFAQTGLVLTSTSFALLLQFGLEELSRGTVHARWLRWIASAMLIVTAILVIAIPGAGPVGASSWLTSSEAAVRYLLALPGALLTALALDRAAQKWPTLPAHPSPYLRGAAISFAVYALLTGIVVPPAPFPPANVLNTAWFFATFGIPVQVGRTICALAATGFLAEAFVVESTREYVRRREEVDRLKDEFISIASHELRAPLAPLRGYAEILLARARADATRSDECKPLETIIAQVSRLAALVDRLLDATRIQAGRLELKRAPMDLVALSRRVVEQFQVTSPVRSLTVLARAPRLAGDWDEARLEQVLANLLDNAVKYSPGGGPIEVLVDTVGGWAQVAVRDHGLGIPKEAQARLFERFYRVPAGGPRPPGLGLGLYISRQIVLLHGGRMWFESEEGKGSTFYFTLPLDRSLDDSGLE